MQNIYVIKKGMDEIDIPGEKLFSKSNFKILNLKQHNHKLKNSQEFFIKNNMLFFLDGFLEDKYGKKVSLKKVFKDFSRFEINKLKKNFKIFKRKF